MTITESRPGESRPGETPLLLDVRNLVVEFKTRGRHAETFRAVDDVSFTISPGETVGLVGESGSGKSTIGRAILGLQGSASGSIRLAGEDITSVRAGTSLSIAKKLQVVFQDPFSSLNPSRTIGSTLGEPLEVQGTFKGADSLREVQRLLDSVGLPGNAASRYPYGFSGGQRQRIAIARALSTSPQLVICDEAVSALDRVTRAQVLNLLSDLQKTTDLSYLFIAHDLPIVSHLSQRTVVLYRGRIMEQGRARLVHEKPLHPYTQALLAAVPLSSPSAQAERRAVRSRTVAETTANAKPAPLAGCPFAPRCPEAADLCWNVRPENTIVGDSEVACHLYNPASGHPDASAQPPAPSARTIGASR
jgi:oligopeptide/dipeptide ABC transporter ATP-binding protein